MFGAGVSPCVYLASGPSGGVALPSIAPRPERPARNAFVLSTAMAAVLGGLSAVPAHADPAGACGPVAADGTVTCAPRIDAYPDGIVYAAPLADPADPDSGILDLGVALQDGVAIALAPGAGSGIDLQGTDTRALTLSRLGAASVSTSGDGQHGVRAVTDSGAITMDAPSIRTAGDGADGIYARTQAGGAIAITGADIATAGTRSRGIDARALAGGDVGIDAAGAITTTGMGATGIVGSTTSGLTRIDVGSVTTTGDYADAIVARGTDIDILVSGAVHTGGYNAYGAYVRANGGDAAVRVDGSVDTEGVRSTGIDVRATGGATVTGAGSVTTSGDSSAAVALFAGTGDAVVDLARVRTAGENADGVFANSDSGDTHVTLGDAEIAGPRSRAIGAFANTGDVFVTGTGSISVSGDYSTGIQAVAGGTANVHVNDISATGYDATAIYAGGNTARITIDGTASSSGASSYGGATVQARGNADYYTGAGGDVFVTNNGRIESHGDGVGALYARGDGDVTIAGAGGFSTSGAGAAGLDLRSGGALQVGIGDVTTEGDGASGIVASSAGSATISAGTISALGAGSGGVRVTAGGPIDLTLAGVESDGTAIRLSSSGDIGLTVGDVLTTGDRADGIYATARGDVTVTAGSVTTYGEQSSGIKAVSMNGDVDVHVGDVSTQGSNLYGVGGRSYFGNVAVTSTGTVSTIGDHAIAVGGQARNVGDAAVTVNTVSTEGYASTAVGSIAAGAASATVNGTVSTLGDRATGVYARAGGFATVVNNGSVATAGDDSAGIVATGDGGVSVSGSGTVSTTGYEARGIVALSYGGAVSVEAGDVKTAGDLSTGIRAIAYGYGSGGIAIASTPDVSVKATSVTTLGADADGIVATADYGNASVTATGTVSTTGDRANGVYAASGGATAVAVNNVTTRGAGAKGVYAYGGTDATVTVSGAVATSGGLDIDDYGYSTPAIGVHAVSSYGTATVAIAKGGSVHTRGDYAAGVVADGYYGAGVVNAGTIGTSGAKADGIAATAYTGDVQVTNSGTVITSGEGSRGIFARAGYNVTVDSGGTVSTSGDSAIGIAAVGGMGASTVVAGTVVTHGANAPGILAGSAGEVRVTADSVSTSGAQSDGIRAVAFGSSGRVVVRAGDISTAGAGSRAIVANALNGSAFAVTSGTVVTTGAKADAITVTGGDQAVAVVGDVLAYGTGSSAVVLHAGSTAYAYVGGLVKGAANGVTITSGAGATLVNDGAITAGTGHAINIKGGAATVTNYGLVSGGVSLTGGDDLFDNENAFFAKNSDFGAGSDRFVNNGQLSIGGGQTPVTVSLANLEHFDNAGLVNLVNGVAGDTLAMPGTAFTGSGDSRLALEVDYGATTVADRLMVGRATGSTVVSLLLPGNAATFTPGTTIVQASAASSPTAFTLASDVRDVGFVHYAIAYRPESFAYQLVGTPSAAAYRTAGYAEGAQQLWYKSADAVTAHLTGLRDAGWGAGLDAKGAFWLQMFGDLSRRGGHRSYTTDGTTLANLAFGYRQDAFGGQLGYDLGGSGGEGGGIVFGVTGGYQNSTVRYAGTGDHAAFDDLNGGVYAGWHGGAAFVNALAKYDRYWGKVNSLLVGYHDTLDGGAYGAQVEAGVRLGSERFFAEPVVSLAYTRTSLDSFAALGTTIGYPDFNGLRGKAGLRLGGTTTMTGGGKLTFYASGEAVHAFKGQPSVTLVNAGGAYRFDGDRIGTYAKGTIGVNVTGAAQRVSGFFEGFGTTGGDYRGGGGRVGLRIKF